MKPATFQLPWNTKKNMEKWRCWSMAQVFLLAHLCSFSAKNDAKAQKSIHNTFCKPSSNFLLRVLFVLLLVGKGPPDQGEMIYVQLQTHYSMHISQEVKDHPFFPWRTQQKITTKKTELHFYIFCSSRKKWNLKAPQVKKRDMSSKLEAQTFKIFTTGFFSPL